MNKFNNLRKSNVRTAIFLTSCILCAGCLRDNEAQFGKPNIILFLVDDMGVMDTSVPMLTDSSGNPVRYPLNDWYRTPHMEKLAGQGIRFSDFYAQTVCSPSRVSILTGQNSARHRTTTWINPFKKNGDKLDPPGWNWKGVTKSDITLPRILRKYGYMTVFVGKAHFGPFGHPGADPLNLGFDINVGGSAIGAPGSYYGADGFGLLDDRRKHEAVPHLEKYHHQDIYLTEALTLEAIEQIDQAVLAETPFFLDMSHYAVHWPYQPDDRFIKNYADTDLPDDVKNYASMIEGIDKSLGDLTNYLKEKSIADNTLILFCGDNGSAVPMGENSTIEASAPLRGKKRSKYEGGTRVPFIVSWGEDNPENPWQQKLPIKSGAIQEQPGSIDDIFPTILELLELAVPESHTIDGQTLSVLLNDQADIRRNDVFLSHFPHGPEYYTSYRKGKWKIIYNYFPEVNKKEPCYELYDLDSDLGESENVAKHRVDVVEELMKEMKIDLYSKNALFPIDSEGNEVQPL